jgi:parallel beta-helix repeat protein
MQTLGISCLLTLAVTFLFSFSEAANTYYMATNGVNTTCGAAQDINTPAKTIAFTQACLVPGDTLYIRSGTYGEVIYYPNGEPGKLITVSGYPRESRPVFNPATKIWTSPVIPGNYSIVKDIISDGVNGAVVDENVLAGWAFSNKNTVTVENVEIKNWYGTGIFMEFSNNITIRNCQIHHLRTYSGKTGTRWYGLYWHEYNNLLVEGNDIYSNPGGGVQIYNGTTGGAINGVVIRNNRLHNNNTITTGTSGVGGLVVGSDGPPISNVQIYNNIFYNNNTVGAGLSPGMDIDDVQGALVANNTSYGNKNWGFIIRATATNTILRNNIAYNNGEGPIIDFSTSTFKSNNLVANPFFANVAAGDFHLTSASIEAINKALPLSFFTTDFAGTTRGTSWDIGAYEFVSNPLTKPATPTNLRVQ